MPAFHDVRLPDQVEKGAAGGPGFNTTIIPMSSGHEQRNIDWSEARGKWDLSYGIQDRSDFETCQAFFWARRGRAYGFRFKDWGDWQITNGTLGVGDGSNTNFQIIKTYEASGPAPYTRRITRPVTGTLVVRVNGTPTVAYTLNPLGVITFTVAPAIATVVTIDCEFDVPVRFDTDTFGLQLETSDAGAIGNLPIVELRE